MTAPPLSPAHLTLALRPAQQGEGREEGAVVVGPWVAALETHDPRGRMVAVARRPGVVAALLGVLYDRTLDSALDLYRETGDAFAAQLEGSFVLLLLDGAAGRVLAVTDRVGTRTLYHLRDGDRVWLSTRPDLPAFTRRPLSMAGLASTLVNGGLPAGLTLYEGVRALVPTDVHDVRLEEIVSTPYWTLPFDPAPPGRPDVAYADDLIHLLRGAVSRRVRACRERPYLSLSGGYDSRGLLGLLSAEGASFRTFAYALPAVRRGSDAEVAGRLAAQYGVPHEALIAYRGDLPRTITRNARQGQGVVPYCEEIDALHDLAEHDPTDVFTGEEVFEVRPAPLRTVAEQLARVHINEFSRLGWLEPFLPPGVFDALRHAWQPEYDAARAQSERWAHGYHKEMQLVLHHHEACRLLRWREQFVAQHANLHVPYLDTPVLDFGGRLPLHLMADKTILKRALYRLDPGLFRAPLASVPGYGANWQAELLALNEDVWARLLAGPSRLDTVIGPDAIRHLARQLPPHDPDARTRAMTSVRKVLGTWRRTPTGRRVFGHPPLKPKVPGLAATILKLLTLRQVLGEPQR
ncbi:asparagine synthase (glutamine-hydrolyzing) [Deinococcus metalli]|uniref:asparagine synthase (glutamine-hydrolyzing) n=1 Tax=Deinococcus metalli TaxID=1141878 RepID=A0A7W8NPL8_9DEIO|nr:asparagine synthase-related protein [Deinococcus metalli]MBB5375920.1 asparagine synthase (glutamine-hydrolyzing) [Deinococcus metalli]GHF36082.1 asparagine synthetase B [Deinococcus metalli]